MKRTIEITYRKSNKQHGLRWGSALISLGLVATACSNGNSALDATSTTGTPVTSVIAAAPTTAIDSTTTSQPGLDPATPDIDAEQVSVDGILAELGASGFVGTVMVANSEGEWAAGFGSADRSADIDNEIDTIFDIGSITKQFTAVAILRLEMDGLLSVDDMIGQYVDGLTTPQSEVTLHQLLTHSGGFTVAIGADDEPITLPDYIARIADTPLAFAPGGHYLYSNVGYSLLTAVIEAVTGDPYEVYLRSALFEPAGMSQTGYVLPDWSDTTIAVGYIGEHVFGRPNEKPWDVEGPWWNLRGNGGILSSMPDMLLWDAALRGNQILDAEAKEKMYTPHVPVDLDGESFYGYGWFVLPLEDGTTLIKHGGTNTIFTADFIRFVDGDTTIVLATNDADTDVLNLGGPIIDALFGGGGGCELDSLTAEAIAAFDVVAGNHRGPEALAMAAWVDVVLSGPSSDDSMLRNYIEQSVGEDMLAELGVETVMGLIQSLQADFDGFSVDRLHQEDALSFHALVVNPQGDEALISAHIGAAPDFRIDCVGFSN